MTAARCALVIAALVAASLSPAFGATHHPTAYRSYGHWPHGPVRITVYPARIDFDRYIDPVSGMYCRNTGWAAVCVPPPAIRAGSTARRRGPFLSAREF